MEKKRGNYLLGLIGAILGIIVAMIPFVIVLKLGYIIFWLTFLFIAFASGGYDLLGGKKGFLKSLIVIVVGLIGVLLAVFFEDLWFIYSEGILEMYDLSIIDIPALIMEAMKYNPEYAKATISNLLLSIGAYLVGVVLYIISTVKESQAEKRNQQNLEQYSKLEPGFQNQELNPANPNPTDFSKNNPSMSNSMMDGNTGSRFDQDTFVNREEEISRMPEESYYREEEETRRPE